MSVSAEILRGLIQGELATVSDTRVLAHIQGMLVEPYAVLRDWDYGEPGQQYPCWTVLEDSHSGAGIAYCEYGFGPRTPWGLVSSEDGQQSMGMDCGWFMTFMEAFFDSFASIELPIWRVFRVEPDGTRVPIADEDAWEPTWDHIYQLRSRDPAVRYDCGHSIKFGSLGPTQA